MKRKQIELVVVDLPKVGMCNLLFNWAKGLVLAHTNNLPLEVYGWSQFYPGPWLRGERIKRAYGKYFKSSQTFANRLRYQYFNFFSKDNLLDNPPLDVDLSDTDAKFVRYQYIPIPKKENFFTDFHVHRAFIKEELLKMVRPKYHETLKDLPKVGIALHIRRGDFVSRRPDMVTKNEYFIEGVKRIRAQQQKSIPVTIFSDGYPEEFEDILQLGNVSFAGKNPDIVDLLYLSSADVIFTSLLSTFSYWAAFISEADIILHPNHIGGSIRAEDYDGFEGETDAYINYLKSSKHQNVSS